MRAMYLNGEKVYVEKICDLDPRSKNKWSCFDGTLQIVKHEDIVRVLNCIFQYVEANPDEIGEDLVDIIRNLNFHSRQQNHKIPVAIIDPKVTRFDDPRKVMMKQKSKQMKLRQEVSVTCCGPLKAIKGGLYKAAKANI